MDRIRTCKTHTHKQITATKEERNQHNENHSALIQTCLCSVFLSLQFSMCVCARLCFLFLFSCFCFYSCIHLIFLHSFPLGRHTMREKKRLVNYLAYTFDWIIYCIYFENGFCFQCVCLARWDWKWWCPLLSLSFCVSFTHSRSLPINLFGILFCFSVGNVWKLVPIWRMLGNCYQVNTIMCSTFYNIHKLQFATHSLVLYMCIECARCWICNILCIYNFKFYNVIYCVEQQSWPNFRKIKAIFEPWAVLLTIKWPYFMMTSYSTSAVVQCTSFYNTNVT